MITQKFARRVLPLCGWSLEACDTFWHVLEESSLASPVEVQTRGILFDLDGVLVDSTPAVARCWSRWAVQYGFNAEEVVRQAHGRPEYRDASRTDAKRRLRGRKSQDGRMGNRRYRWRVPLPGVLEILRALPADQWAIVTSCTPALAEVRIRVAGLPTPKKIVTSGDVRAVQAGARSVLEGCGIAWIGAHDCVVVEDAPAGIRAGRAAESRVLALRTTEADDLLKAAGATWIVNDLSKVSLGPVATANCCACPCRRKYLNKLDFIGIEHFSLANRATPSRATAKLRNRLASGGEVFAGGRVLVPYTLDMSGWALLPVRPSSGDYLDQPF